MDRRSPSETLLRLLGERSALFVLTGAGVSAESGLATFRGPDGLWEGRDPATLATPEAFARDPETVWRFYAWRRRQAHRAIPNAGHLAIAALERARPQTDGFLLATQNVDGLHERAGSTRMVRLHGSLWRSRCAAEGVEIDDDRDEFDEFPPRCACGGPIRPGVVWFGEALPEAAWALAERGARACALAIVAGTSSLVYPAAALPDIAKRAGAYVVEINPERTPLSDRAHERLAGPAGEILPSLVGPEAHR